MSASVAAPQKQLIKRLLKSGRWNNASEIIRHGLELVKREVESEELSPYPPSALAEVYRKQSAAEKQEEARMAQACARPSPGDLN